MPTTQDIISEKTPKMAAEFDKTGLKHVEPIVKTGVEGREILKKILKRKFLFLISVIDE